jgi:hypothetical protein
MKSTTQKSLSLSILSFLLIISFSNSAVAQFWTEDFVPTNVSGLANGYVGANPGAWTVTTLGGNTGSLANEWYISCTESSMQPNNCGAICPPVPLPPPTPYIAQSLHLGANALIGDNGALYAETGAKFNRH